VRNYDVERPVSEEQFRIYKNLYAYDHTPLKEKIEATDDSDPVWKALTVTFDAAYGDERVTAKLYLPKNAKPPYQTVVHFPGGYAFFMDKIDAVSLYWIRYMVQSGRAVLFPIYKGTYERRVTTRLGSMGLRDQLIQICKDLSRSVDYLKTRSDIDGGKIAYHGFSTGAILALPCVALEDRFQTVILQGGALFSVQRPPETDPLNFAPRIHVPVLMVNGKDDFQYPVSLQLPLFRILGSAPGDKRHFVVDGGHVLPRNLIVKETLDWLDRYLGPAPGVP
jgi:cephalosporin-C deacetylase-like acetyl esterase